MKACIPDSAPYLSLLLKLDNLPPFCNDVSETVLHRLRCLFHVAGTEAPMLW